jgi:O-antigen ligase
MNFLKVSKFFLYLAPFSVVIVYQGTLFPFIVGKYTFFRVVVELALLFFVWGWAITRNQEPGTRNQESLIPSPKLLVTSPLAIAIAIFVLIFLLAGFLGYNPSASFWSNFERGEGGFQLLHLFIFFVLLISLFKDKESWRRLFKISLLAAVLVIAYGVLGALGIKDFIAGGFCERFAGSLGNSAYTGAYLIFAMFFAGYLLTEDWRKPARFKKWFWLVLIVIFFAFLLLTQTRGALLGLGMGILAGMFYLFFALPAGRWRWLMLALIIVSIVSGSLAIKYRRYINLAPTCEAGNKILNVSFEAQTFQTRLWLWQKSWEAFKERPLLGWGPENFAPAFEKHYDNPKETAWYDRAHNIFFDYLAMTGILGLLSFIGIFAVYYWRFFKSRNCAEEDAKQRENKQKSTVNGQQSTVQRALLFALPIAYLVQGLVLFDVLPIYISLFLFLAFSVYKFQIPSAKLQTNFND